MSYDPIAARVVCCAVNNISTHWTDRGASCEAIFHNPKFRHKLNVHILCSTYAIRKITQNEIPDGRKIEEIRMAVVCYGMPTVVPYRQGRQLR